MYLSGAAFKWGQEHIFVKNTRRSWTLNLEVNRNLLKVFCQNDMFSWIFHCVIFVNQLSGSVMSLTCSDFIPIHFTSHLCHPPRFLMHSPGLNAAGNPSPPPPPALQKPTFTPSMCWTALWWMSLDWYLWERLPHAYFALYSTRYLHGHLMCIANHLPLLEASWLVGLIVAWGKRVLVEGLGRLRGFSFISEDLVELSKGANGWLEEAFMCYVSCFHFVSLSQHASFLLNGFCPPAIPPTHFSLLIERASESENHPF